MIILVNT